jgi:uncharacterized protein (TIGR02145 family)
MKTKIKKLLIPLILLGCLSVTTNGCKKDKETVPEVTTTSVTEITANSANVGGDVTDDGGSPVTARGLIYSKIQNPSFQQNDGIINQGEGKGKFNGVISGLTPNTIYYVRAYATNDIGTSIGNQVNFTTLSTLSSVSTNEVTVITAISAVCGGNVTEDGGKPVTARGVVWSENENPSIEENLGLTTDGSGSGEFESNISGLLPNTNYYVRAYATNSEGTAYGSQIAFTTLGDLATITTNPVINITATTATCGGNITDDGNTYISARGVVWSKSENPTLDDNEGFTDDGTGVGDFVSSVTGLTHESNYYVRAYATNNIGTNYGSQVAFTTLSGLAIVTTSQVTNITATTAFCGGNITEDGGSPVIARGVVWSKSENPSLDNNEGYSDDGAGTGEFVSTINGLTHESNYYVRAYATSDIGTSYGNQMTFTTLSGLALVTTSQVTNITATTAVCGGNITEEGGAPVTARGVVWSNSENPTVTNNLGLTSNGSGVGGFVSNITGLTPETEYYVRAYATNSFGTAYGNQWTFTTIFICGTTTVTDIDGNVYNTVLIGDQCWMKEDLRTTKYRDGSVIPNLTDNTEWQNTTSGTYVWYNNNVSFKNSYGALYNGITVSNTSPGLCPIGWHVPATNDFDVLFSYLGGTTMAGGKMKSTRTTPDPHPRWESPNTGATNESGWTGYPGGSRNENGIFGGLGFIGEWWTTGMILPSGDRISRQLGYNFSYIFNLTHDNNYGISVRCLKD